MTGRTSDIGELDLMAYVDGHLDPGRRREVEAFLAENPTEAERIRDLCAINEALNTLYHPVMAETVPKRLEAALQPQPRRWIPVPMRYAAAAASVVVSGGLGWWIGDLDRSQPQQFVDQGFLSQISAAYRGGGTLEGLSQASLGDGDGQPMAWLAEQTALDVGAPNLSALGYTMAGKRVAETSEGDVVEVTYRNESSGDRLSLYMRARWQESQPRFRATEYDGVSTAYWYDGPLAFAVAGENDPEVIRDIGMSIYDLISSTTDGDVLEEGISHAREGSEQPTRDLQIPELQIPERLIEPIVSEQQM